jgi:hypothetical protein
MRWRCICSAFAMPKISPALPGTIASYACKCRGCGIGPLNDSVTSTTRATTRGASAGFRRSGFSSAETLASTSWPEGGSKTVGKDGWAGAPGSGDGLGASLQPWLSAMLAQDAAQIPSDRPPVRFYACRWRPRPRRAASQKQARGAEPKQKPGCEGLGIPRASTCSHGVGRYGNCAGRHSGAHGILYTLCQRRNNRRGVGVRA